MKIDQFERILANSTTEKQAEAILRTYLSAAGFRAYAFTYYSGNIKAERKLKYHCVSDGLRPWHQHYLEQGYATVDRTLENAHIFTLPLFWDVNEQLSEAKNKRENRIRLESIEFGIDKGLSIPVHGPNQDFASLTLHQFLNENCLQHYKTHQYEWMSAAQLYYHYIKKIIHDDSQLVEASLLTPREEQCLRLTAQLWRVEQIAKELNISPRTVNFHIQNANKKLGTNNKYQAIFKIF